jgi:hypothetical protein
VTRFRPPAYSVEADLGQVRWVQPPFEICPPRKFGASAARNPGYDNQYDLRDHGVARRHANAGHGGDQLRVTTAIERYRTALRGQYHG